MGHDLNQHKEGNRYEGESELCAFGVMAEQKKRSKFGQCCTSTIVVVGNSRKTKEGLDAGG